MSTWEDDNMFLARLKFSQEMIYWRPMEGVDYPKGYRYKLLFREGVTEEAVRHAIRYALDGINRRIDENVEKAIREANSDYEWRTAPF